MPLFGVVLHTTGGYLDELVVALVAIAVVVLAIRLARRDPAATEEPVDQPPPGPTAEATDRAFPPR